MNNYRKLTDFEKLEVKRLRAAQESVRSKVYWSAGIPTFLIVLTFAMNVLAYYLEVGRADWIIILDTFTVTMNLYLLRTPMRFFIADYKLRKLERLAKESS